jgi:YfiH family protein
VCFPQQVHGADIEVIADLPDLMDPGVAGADAVVTAVAGLPLGVLVADCMPVLLADPVHRVAAAAHAGRRGLAAGVLQNTVRAMVGLGADPSSTSAVIGPSACGRCYEVPEDMRDEVDATVPGTAARTSRGTASLDLPAGAVGTLNALGVARVEVLGICTMEDERFYSFRRSRNTGRFAGVVMLDGDD